MPAALGGGSFRFTVLDHTHLTAPVPLPANLQKYKSDNHARAILYHQKRMDEQKRAQLAAFSGGSAPPATPVFFLLGCDPMIFLPLNPVRTAAEAEDLGIIRDYYEFEDELTPHRGFVSREALDIWNRNGFGGEGEPFSLALDVATRIIEDYGEDHGNAVASVYGSHLGVGMAVPPSGAVMRALPPSTTGAPFGMGVGPAAPTNPVSAAHSFSNGYVHGRPAGDPHGQQPFVSPVPFNLGPAQTQEPKAEARGRVSLSPADLAQEEDGEADGHDEAGGTAANGHEEEREYESAKTPARGALRTDNVPSPILRREPWPIVKEKMLALGWTWQKGTDLYDFFYVRPGCSVKGGELGFDYYPGEESLKDIASEEYGWEGEDTSLWSEGKLRRNTAAKHVDAGKGRSRKPAKKYEAPSTAKKPIKTRVETTPTPKKTGMTPTDIKGTPIKPTDEFTVVWDKLKHSGWKAYNGKGLQTEYSYVPPGGKPPEAGGVLNRDYVLGKRGVRSYARAFYKWDPKGAEKRREKEKMKKAEEKVKKAKERIAEKKRMEAEEKKRKKAEAKAAKQAEEKKKQKEQHLKKQKEQELKAQATKRKAAEMSTSKTAAKKDSKAKSSKRSKSVKKNGRGSVKDSRPATNDKHFRNRISIKSPSTPSNKTKPQDPGKPRLSESPVVGRSLSPDDKGFYDWGNLWPRLQKTGWTYEKRNAGAGLIDWYYIRPNRDPSDTETMLGVDYFASQEDVIHYQEMKDIEDGEMTIKKTSRRKRTSTPTKREKSAMMDAFDSEAIVSPPTTSSKQSAMKANLLQFSTPSSSSFGWKRGTGEQLAVAWWKTHPIPDSIRVWRILQKKLKFRYSNCWGYRFPKEYDPITRAVPGVNTYAELEKLRLKLCQVGIPDLCNNDLSSEERVTIIRWVSTAQTPLGIQEGTSVEQLSSVKVHSSKSAWESLETSLKWTKTNEAKPRYYRPGRLASEASIEEEDYFTSLKAVQRFLQIDGVFEQRYNMKWENIKTPDLGKGRKIPEDMRALDYAALTLWAAAAPIPTFIEPRKASLQKDKASDEGKVDDEQSDRGDDGDSDSYSDESGVGSDGQGSPESAFGEYDEAQETGSKSFLSRAGETLGRVLGRSGSAKESEGMETPTKRPRKRSLMSTPDWDSTWPILQGLGYTEAESPGGSTRLYLPGAQKGKRAKKGRDYFETQFELRTYVSKITDERGEEKADKEDERRAQLVREAQEQMSNISGTPVQWGDDWPNVFEKMKYAGWQKFGPLDLMTDWGYYHPSGRKYKKGVQGVDWVLGERGLKEYASKHLGWSGNVDGVA